MTPLDAALDCLRRAREQLGPNALVSLSGKDSAVCAHLALKVFDQVTAFTMVHVPELEVEELATRRIADKLGIECRSYMHPDMVQWLRSGYLCRPQALRPLRYRDVEASAIDDTGADVVLIGWRSSDSQKRRAVVARWGDVDVPHKRAYPVFSWKTASVESYMDRHRIPVPPRMETGASGRSSGFNLTADVVRMLKRDYPGDYAKVLEVFPRAKALTFSFGDAPGGAEHEIPVGDGPEAESA
jgi:3'-phosphoadenosine 5'-phosphosulfate sulfotransferase (PAPS reductase)/FAD synthetase